MTRFFRVSSGFLAWAFFSRNTQVAADVNLERIPQGARGYTETCIRVLNQAVNCDDSLRWVDGTGNYYGEDVISTLCTSTCKESLDVYLDQVKAACNTSRYDGPDGLSYHGGYSAEQASERFNYICMNNSAGDNCNLVMGKLAGINPENQQATSPADPGLNCNECALSGMKTQLEMPLASKMQADPAIASMVSSIASSCKTTISITAAPSASPPWVMLAPQTATSTAPPASSASCTGKIYSTQDGDTCMSVSEEQRIDTVQLLAANNLLSECRNFPSAAGSQLCIPSSSVCDPYMVKTGDTCTSIANSSKATWAQIVAWNPELGRACQNIGEYVGYAVCVSNPGGGWIDPHPSPTTTGPEPTTTIDTVFTLSFTPIPMDNAITEISVTSIWADDGL